MRYYRRRSQWIDRRYFSEKGQFASATRAAVGLRLDPFGLRVEFGAQMQADDLERALRCGTHEAIMSLTSSIIALFPLRFRLR